MRSSFREAALVSPDPAAYLPHRYPFLHLDRIVALEPGVSAVGMVGVTADTLSFPPLLLVEAMAQLGGIAAGQEEGSRGILAALDRVELPETVLPGVRVRVTVRIVKAFGTLFLVEGEAREGERLLARAELTLAVSKG
ncbi:hydroxymyristoyl-ACP dehydratase [Geomobilimonas luticola]|uniref:Hydroxymyristoyl-ACP dehydratase n=1 Tax=Geomobilimonas luticola TaxID=1114878 RepID=A0ABS5SEE9_9BACT|nr:hydroxymyristoyl-ACP dehydratase [Geomobilimonas luticola]MBT0652392.1 hydroxymyristoyl-ACP dehydratase [Geomobilimonas luticola]